MYGEKIEEKRSVDHKEQRSEERYLILHNDDFNTFDHVIESLVDICEHEPDQAEQCAYITHYKGKCDIKKGPFQMLRLIKNLLVDRGLNVTID